MQASQVSGGCGVERQLTSEHLEQNHADRIDVGGWRRSAATGLLRREILGRPPDDIRLLIRMDGGESPGDAEISHLDALVRRDEDVMRFKVAVNQASPVGISYSGAYLDDQLEGFLDGKTTAIAEKAFQVGARNPFHNQEEPAGVQAKIVDGDNIWVGKIGGGLGFLVESQAEFLVLGEILAQDFYGNRTFEGKILGPIYDCHASYSDGVLELVAIVEEGRILGGLCRHALGL